MSTNDNKFGFVLKDAFISVFGIIFAGIFFSSELRFHFIYGLWCSFIGLAGFLHAPAEYFSEANPRKKICIWTAYGCLLVAIAIWFFVWSYKIVHPLPPNPAESKPVEAEAPAVSLDIGPVLDSKDPWGQILELHNNSEETISNVVLVFTWRDLSNSHIIHTQICLAADKVAPHMTQAIHNYWVTPPYPIFVGEQNQAWINATVVFTPTSQSPTNFSFKFSIFKKKDGSFDWEPDGEGDAPKIWTIFTNLPADANN